MRNGSDRETRAAVDALCSEVRAMVASGYAVHHTDSAFLTDAEVLDLVRRLVEDSRLRAMAVPVVPSRVRRSFRR